MNKKSKITIGILALVLTMFFSIKKNTLENKNDIFIESDNIAYAEGGNYSCVPRSNSYCPLPSSSSGSGQGIHGYKYVYPE